MLSDRIITLRTQRGWTQQELARQLRISCNAVKNWETGISEPFAKHIRKLAELFNVTSDYLLEIDCSEVIRIGHLSPKNQHFIRTAIMMLAEPDTE